LFSRHPVPFVNTVPVAPEVTFKHKTDGKRAELKQCPPENVGPDVFTAVQMKPPCWGIVKVLLESARIRNSGGCVAVNSFCRAHTLARALVFTSEPSITIEIARIVILP
jgi:hypothetical protein